MKTLLTFVLLFWNTLSNAQQVRFFGDAIFKAKIKTLYYRFDAESFGAKQAIPIERSFTYGKKFSNSYGIEFEEGKLRKHRFIYFSNSVIPSKDTVLVNQNRVDLTALLSLIDAKKEREESFAIANDLFLDDHFEKLTNIKALPTDTETKFIGTYTVSSNYNDGMNEITLDSSMLYHSVGTDEVNSFFFQNEAIGRWKMGVYHYNSKMPALKIGQIYTFNRQVGLRSKPADVGSSYDMVIKGERLLYPTGTPALKELKRK